MAWVKTVYLIDVVNYNWGTKAKGKIVDGKGNICCNLLFISGNFYFSFVLDILMCANGVETTKNYLR